MNALTFFLTNLLIKLQSHLWLSNGKAMTTNVILKAITSNNPYKVWHAACEITQQSQHRDKILPLIPYLPEIKTKTVGRKTAESILTHSPFVDFAIKTLEFHRDNRGCPCSLYMELQMFNPTQEEENGNVKIVNTVREPNRDADYYVARCRKCGNVFKVLERRRHCTWWKWTTNVPDPWTFDDHLDFRSPNNTHRLIYDGYLCEVAMGGPLRGECFLEAADKQRIKIHDTCGGPPAWETSGQMFAIPIWTIHKGQRIGVVDLTKMELTMFHEPFGVLHMHSFDKNLISVGSVTLFDISKKRVDQVIRLV